MIKKFPSPGRISRAPLVLLCAASTLLCVTGVAAQGFAAIVSPPRFELTAKPGEKVRQVIEIGNAGTQAAKYHFKTADWTLDKSGGVSFDESLQPGSCRPWVAIEKREVTVAGGGKYRYRFEVAPPADAPAGECRFALLIEGDEQTVKAANGPPVPVAGRIGVIVYLSIGGAAPKLELVGSQVATINGEATPVLQIKNSGNAHGRLDGFLSGTDAGGKKLEFSLSTLPVLPGETRTISLIINRGEQEALTKIKFPITVRGNLEWADKSVPFEQRFTP